MDNRNKMMAQEIDSGEIGSGEIDLRRLLGAVWKKAWIVVLSALLCGALALVGTKFLVTPQYQTSVLFHMGVKTPIGNTVSSNDIYTAKNFVDSYIVILKSRTTLNEVIDRAGVDCTYGEVLGMVSAAAVNETEIFRVTVTNPDPFEAEKIANAIADVVPNRISTIIKGSDPKVLEYAITPRTPSSPNYYTSTALGLMLGALLAAGIIAVIAMLDVTIKDEEDIKSVCRYPVLAVVPNMRRLSKRSYSQKYGKQSAEKAKKHKGKIGTDLTAVIGADIDFAAAEAYKLLRTKLQYSLAGDQSCRVFMVSSAMAGEGKSVTSSNLAYCLAQLGKKVLLMDCDMRRPTLAESLGLMKYPGLSECLTGANSIHEVLQQISTGENDKNPLYVISAGIAPPNPIELMDSEKMHNTLSELRKQFDFIIMDMPPIGDVSDALVCAKFADGVLIVARQNYGNRISFREAVQQFEFINVRILGVLFNCATNNGGIYQKKSYKYRGYRYYGYRRAAEYKAKNQ